MLETTTVDKAMQHQKLKFIHNPSNICFCHIALIGSSCFALKSNYQKVSAKCQSWKSQSNLRKHQLLLDFSSNTGDKSSL